MTEWPDPVYAALLEERAEDLYEHAPCGYLSILDDGLIGKINSTLLDWTGYGREDLVGRKRFADLLTIGGRIYYETHFQPLLRMQSFVREIAFDMSRRDGEPLPVLVNATQSRSPDHAAVTRITVFDATDRRRYERELLEARRRAEEAAQARSDLVAMISHDVRAPLSAMTTAIALLERMQPTPQQAKYITILRSSMDHALALVNNVLDLSRIESGRTLLREEEIAIREVVDEIVRSARAAAMRKPELNVTGRVDDAVPDRLLGDRAKIGQVFANLLMNAVKFTERGLASIEIALRTSLPDSVTLDIAVSDTGIGIPVDRLPHIFDEFTQASDEIAQKYGGSGLGLAITRKLLRLYGTEVHVTSTVGHGTVFSFPLTLKRVG